VQEPARIAFVSEGDAESHHAFSGAAKYVVDHLRLLGHSVVTLNASPGTFGRWSVAALSFRPDRDAWRTQFRLGAVAAAARSHRVRRLFTHHRERIDVVLQIGPALDPPGAGTVPFALFCDWNMALSLRFRDNPYSSAHRMSMRDAERINARHARIYRDAAVIFTMSEYLRRSFIADYGLAAHRLVTVHAGPNMDTCQVPAIRAGQRKEHRPTVLFSGREFLRKGGDVLVASFRRIRKRLPDARLVILGPRKLDLDEPGIEFAGVLDKNDPRQFAQLAGLYAEADVFCLPTRMEPLGIVVLEAMHFGLPCVTSDVGAMSEMVVDGQTGFTVAPDDLDALTDRLARLLRDPALAAQMGMAGQFHTALQAVASGTFV
jgi:glycosyltransferase involved in cell wall biosynthesis